MQWYVHVGKPTPSKIFAHARFHSTRLLPVVTCFALCWGMGAAPKQELMINLVCLAHPPQTQTHALVSEYYDPMEGMSMRHVARAVWNAPRVRMGEVERYYEFKEREFQSVQGYADEVVVAAGDSNATRTMALPELTAADRWLIDVQRRIAADKAKQRLDAGRPLPGDEDIAHSDLPPMPSASPAPTTPTRPSDDLPSGEVPHRPVSNPEDEPNVPERQKPVNSPERSSSPRKGGEMRPGEIDPRLCKKDPRTQAAAAKLTMSELRRILWLRSRWRGD